MAIQCFKRSIKRFLVTITCLSMFYFIIFVSNRIDTLNNMQWNGKSTHQDTFRKDTHQDMLMMKQNNLEVENNLDISYNIIDDNDNNDVLSLVNVTHKRHSTDDFPYRAIDAHAHHYVIDPTPWTERCSHLSILIYIHSAVTYGHKRAAIRSTWGSKLVQDKLNMKIVFIVGISKNTTEKRAIKIENDRHSDIIQEDYIDTYNNLSLKAISAMKFIHLYCPKVPLILKTDDDLYINIPILIDFLEKKLPKLYINTDKFMICNRRSEERPMRYNSTKWKISKNEYKYRFYPTYCQGAAFFLSSEAVHAIMRVANGEEFYKLDDVFLTGMLGEKAGVAYIGINQEYETNVHGYTRVRNADKYMFSVQGIDRMVKWWGKHVQDVV